MPNTYASGLHARHAVSRALATSNTTPLEATFKLQSAKVRSSQGGQVLRSEVTVSIRKPRPLTQREPRGGLWGKGCRLWHWVAEGGVSGGFHDGEARFEETASEATQSLGFRMVVAP